MRAYEASKGSLPDGLNQEPDGLERQAQLERQVRRFMSQNGNSRQTAGKIAKRFRQKEGGGSLKEVRVAVRQIRRDDRLDSRARIKADHFAPFLGIRLNLNHRARLTQCQ